ncbi:MAG: TonB-dependent receptor [Deltaproteobacteria bacterium]|nr:TonB-dependent receptor [Deltaproteobacteria bacterium]
MKKRRLRLFLLFMSFALILSSGSMVLAQEDTGKDSEEKGEFLLEEVIVTGSRIAREEGFGQISPVTVIGEEDIDSFGLTRIEDVLNTLPQLEASQQAFYSNGATGTAALDLRGLSPERTLVLMNGRRIQPGGTNTQVVDINQVPSAMVERVEVLTGGASAIYGADAVAGVVNFIMRKVDGLEISLGASAYQHDNDNTYMQGLMDEAGYFYPNGNSGFDGRTYDISLIAGGDFADGRGNATVYASWRDNDELLSGERDYSSCALDATGTYCGGSGNAIVPNFYISPLDPVTGEANYDEEILVTLQPDSSFADFSDNFYNYAPINHFQRPDERWSAGAFLDYEVNENATAYMEVQYFNDHSRAQIAESGTFFAEPYHLPLDNALFPAAFRASLEERFPGVDMFEFWIGKRNVEGGPRVEVLDHSSFRIVGGIKGAITDNWDYDVSYVKGRTISSSTYMNDFFAPKIATAVDSEACAADPDCLPYNVFTYQGISAEAAAGLSGVAISNNETGIQSVSAVVTGDTGFGLSAGNIFVVAGLEYREETFDDIRDYVYEEGLLLGQGGPRPSLSGEFDVKEAFGEASIPLLADMPGAKDLTLNLALRFSDHNMTGSDETYRIGLDWHTNDILRIRTGYNRAVRSPNIEELFETQFVNLWSGTDPCSGPNPIYTQEQCAKTGVTAAMYGNVPPSPASQYNMLRGGNPNLQPEEADTITFGIVVTPQESLTMSVDYWNIDLDKTIDRIGSELIIDLCVVQDQLCQLIHRSPGNGNLWMGTDVYVEDTMQNIGKQQWEGLDFAASYWLEGLEGTWNFNIIGTWMLTKETTPIAGDESTKYDCVGLINTECYPTPKWRHTASLTYDSHESWTGMLRWRYFSKVDYDGGVDEIVNLVNMNYFDLSAVYKFGKNHDITLGINNVLDKDAPLVGDTMNLTYGNANAITGFYDTLGRFFYTKATFRF